MDERKASERNWSVIEPEVLNAVAKKLIDISDFVRYCAVCKAWRSSIKIADHPLQFPWIFELQKYPYVDDLTFHSVTFKKTYHIRPKYLHQYVSGPSEGYMYAHDLKEQNTSPRSLLNPLNNHEIYLPAFSGENIGSWIGPRQNQMGEYAAFASDKGLNVCHIGDNQWRQFDLIARRQCNYFCLQGKIFGVEKLNGRTTIIDINARDQVNIVIPPVEGHTVRGKVYLVEASGDILRVFQQYKPKYKLYSDYDVHRLEVNDDNSAHWVKVNDIGDHAIFVDNLGVFAIKASEIAGIKRNSIYCMNNTENTHFYIAVRIDIETRTTNYFPSPFNNPQCWFMPNLHQIHTR